MDAIADNVPITAGTGTTVGTDERTIAAVAVQVQRVDEQGGTAITSGQVTATTTAATLVAARDTRKHVVIVNQGTVNVAVGEATVTMLNAFLLVPGAGVTLATTALVQVIASTGSVVVSYIETYDS